MELMILNVILISALVLLIAICFYLGGHLSSKEHFLFIMVLMMTGFILLGNLIEYDSSVLSDAVGGRKLSYLGGCFAEWFLLLFVLRFFHYRTGKKLAYLLLAMHTIVGVAAMTFTRNHLLYREMQYTTYHGVARISTTAGPMNYLHRVLMLFYFIVIPAICLQFYMTHKKSTMRKYAVALSFCALLPGIGYILMMTGVTGMLDPTPVFFAAAVFLAFFLVIRQRMFDTLEVARDQLIADLSDAVVILDEDMQLLYCNEKAKEVFSEMETEHGDSNVLTQICLSASEQYERNGRTYNLSISRLHHRKRFYGYTMVFSDVTDLADYAGALEDEVNLKISEIERIQHQVLFSFANMIEMRDGMTGQHVKRTTEYVRLLVTEMLKRHLYPEELNTDNGARMISAAAIHDIGKIAISDSILQKPARLTPEEFEVIKTHAATGSRMIDEILMEVGDNKYLNEAKKMANYHHERWDGSGYPDGLAGEEIPLSARIMAVADVFDALISKRQYKEAFTLDKAFSIIEESRGTHFDPVVVDVFLDMRNEIEHIVACLEES